MQKPGQALYIFLRSEGAGDFSTHYGGFVYTHILV